MSIDPISGPRRADGQTVAPARVSPVSSGSSSEHLALNALKTAGTVQGRVETMLPGGAVRIATEHGRLTFNLAPPQFEQGTSVRLSLDQQTGQIAIQPTASPQQPFSASGAGFVSAPTITPQIPLSIHEVAPVAIGAAGADVPQSAQAALGSVFPSSNSPAFAVISAFFPIVMRSGAVERLTSQQNSRYATGSRVAKMAGAAHISGIEQTQDGATHLSWTMPYFSDGAELYAHWRQSRKDASKDEPARTHTFLQVTLEPLGLIQIDALQIGNEIAVHVVSAQKMPAALIHTIQKTAARLSQEFELQIAFSHDHGQASLDTKFLDQA